MHLRRLIIFIILLSAYSLYKLPYDKFAQGYVQKQLHNLQSQGVIAEVEKIDLKFPINIAYKNLAVTLPVKPFGIPINFAEGIFKPKLLNLFLLDLSGSHEGKLYDGDLSIDFDKSFSNNTHATLSLKNANLGLHEYLRLSGIEGSLSIVGDANLEQNIVRKANAAIQIENGNMKGDLKLYGFLKVPSIKSLNTLIKFSVDNASGKIETCRLSSSFGTANCRGNFSLTKQSQLASADVKVDVDLNDSGVKELASYFAVGAGVQPGTLQSSWQISIVKSINEPLTSKVSLR